MVWVCKPSIEFVAGTLLLYDWNPFEKSCCENEDLDAKPAAARNGKALAIEVESAEIIFSYKISMNKKCEW